MSSGCGLRLITWIDIVGSGITAKSIDLFGSSRERPEGSESFGFLWSSYQGRMGDVSVSEGDEGRGSLR